MALNRDEIQTALRVKRIVSEYFSNNPSINSIQAKELMPQFIKNGVFQSNHRDGLPIRDLLRLLDRENQLNLIPQVHFEQKDKNKNWYFINTNK